MLGCNNWCLFGLELVQTRIPSSVGEGLQSKTKAKVGTTFWSDGKGVANRPFLQSVTTSLTTLLVPVSVIAALNQSIPPL